VSIPTTDLGCRVLTGQPPVSSAYFEDARITKISSLENCAGGMTPAGSTSVAMMAYYNTARNFQPHEELL